MDKYEYKIRVDEIDSLIRENKYKEAVEVADTIDWRNVRNSKTLCTISDLYKKCKRYEDSRDVLLLAYQRNPGGRMILYSLCELSIKLGDIVNAIEYLKEYAQAAPKDPGRFVLKYKLYTAEEVGLDERIQVLEELQQYECRERWMYELAYLYHMQGYSDKCIEECDQIVIYFGEGKYVIKALELKANHQPLTAQQDALLKRLTSPVYNEVLVKDMDVSKFNTIDLQKELASSMAEVFFNDTPKKVEEPVEQEPVEPEPAVEEDTTVLTNNFAFEETIYQEPEVNPQPVEEEITQETQMYNTQEVEAALSKEPSVSRTVLPKQGRFDEMHEVMPQTSKNPAIVFPNYDDMVSMEGDGQISFNIPEQEMVEKQITGQISIEDVLAEWERLRSANERTWRENMRRKVIKQTSEMFKDFDESSKSGLLEQLETEVTESASVELTKEEADRLGIELPEEVNLEEEPSYEGVEGEMITISEPEPMEEEPAVEEVQNTQDIREIVFEEEPEEEPTFEELSFDRTPFMTEEPKEEEFDTKVLPKSDDIDNYLMAFAEASEERDLADQAIMAAAMTSANVVEELLDGVADEVTKEETEEVEKTEVINEPEEVEEPETSEEPEEVEEPEAVEETAEEPLEEEEIEESEIIEELPIEETQEVSEIEAEESEAAEEPIEEAPEEIEETEEAVEAEESEEDTEDFERYDEAEIEEAEAFSEMEEAEAEETEESEEAGEELEENEVSEETKEDDFDVPYEETEEPSEPEIRPSGFTREQEERFESFIQTEISREALKLVLEKISMDSNTGNAIVGSEDVDSAIEFAKALIMEISSKEEISGKVAKIKASTLNAKDAEETLSKLYDGALIIQDANELRRETLDAVRRVVEVEDKKLFIVLTISRRAKHRFIMDNSDMLSSFNVSYDIEALNNKELVEYAKAYAYSREYTIDEVGMLALHTRIEGKQTNEHSVTVSEVRDIVDQAILKAGKKNAKHFIDVLVGKRYDENDMVVLKEKDFAE